MIIFTKNLSRVIRNIRAHHPTPVRLPQFQQRPRLNLLDELLLHPKLGANVRQPQRLAVVQPEPQPNHGLLPRRQRPHQPPNILLHHLPIRHLARAGMLRILHERAHGAPVPPVSPRGHAPLPLPRIDALVQTAHLLGALPVKGELGHRYSAPFRHLLIVRPPPHLVHEYPLLDSNVVDLGNGAGGHPDGPTLLADVLGHLLLDPPNGIRRESKSQLRVEFFRGAGEADDALLAGVLELDGVGAAGGGDGRFFGGLARDRDDEAEVGLDEGRLGALGAADLPFEAGDGVVGRCGPLGECGGTQQFLLQLLPLLLQRI
mmetsp:Transcript_9214/g.13888  ORF Transcript_9214/g.13888 Transcript_9214/m.13888 type:complete len:317 (+) Transcript_9214:28-978(+)